ncbi:MAG: cytochrome-c oxidase, cbb3-type subunit III [Hyphomicrobiales bacterium]|nr:cytochrome-c oxidase, cbb3-type subunit III [Hyphomicrobiales bacterium]
MSGKEIDEFTGVETTGHDWDGIKELNSPLPRWWLWTFYATIIFSVGYVLYYPAIPLINSATQGISGITNRQIVEQELKAATLAKSSMISKIETASLQEIRDTDELFRFSVAGGQSMFKVYCTQCHGSGAQGAPGYPNLNDDDWLWGGDIEAVYTSIKHGIRNDEDEDTRISEMPAFGVDDLLDSGTIRSITHRVLEMAGLEFDAKMAQAGASPFIENCADCHGENGKGDVEQGAPNLTDAIWFYGDKPDEIVAQISSPRHGVMPAWGKRLGEASVKQLAVYIHSLGGGL